MFFFNEVKKAAKAAPKVRAAALPLESLARMECKGCPRNTDPGCSSPKLEATGAASPDIYILQSKLSEKDDRQGDYLRDAGGDEVVKKLGAMLWKRSRTNAVTNCYSASGPSSIEIECCRGRVVRDIESSKPLVLVTIGDEALRWATGLTSAIPHRGTPMVGKFGTHVCWIYPLLHPNYAYKESKFGGGEYETTMRVDCERLQQLVVSGTVPAPPPDDPFQGIHCLLPCDSPGRRGTSDAEAFDSLERHLTKLQRARRVGLDIETNGLRPWRVKDPQILTAAVGTFDHVVAFPLDMVSPYGEGWTSQRWRRKAWDLFGDWIMSSPRKVAHNLHMEQAWLSYFYGRRVLRGTEWEDSMAAGHTLDERSGSKSLEVATVRRFGFNLKAQSNLDVKKLAIYPLEKVLKYNGGDAKWCLRAFEHDEPALDARPADREEYEAKLRLIPTLVGTEHWGIEVDMDYARNMSRDWSDKIAALRKKITRQPHVKEYERKFRHTFNPGNSDHVLRLLRDLLQRPEVAVEERGGAIRYTTESEALETIPEAEVPVAGMVLELREGEKLQSTYLTPLVEGGMLCTDGALRTQYGCMVAETGRLNSEDPNLQNFPKRKNKEVRGTVVPGAGRVLMPSDYGQLEFRAAGMCSEDDELLRACWTNYDVHLVWAEIIHKKYPQIVDWIVDTFGVDWDEKGMKTLRQETKNKWVFPSIFGASVNSRAASLHLPKEVAKELDGAFFDQFRGVKRWQKRIVDHYEKHLYVETLSGRRRRGPLSLNQIINTPIQGTGADLVKAAMCALSERAEAEENPNIDPRINVHDDLTFTPDADAVDKTVEIIGWEMTKPRFSWCIVPLVVEVSVGPRWHECKEIAVLRGDVIHSLRNPYS